jgi:hypothetical protein
MDFAPVNGFGTRALGLVATKTIYLRPPEEEVAEEETTEKGKQNWLITEEEGDLIPITVTKFIFDTALDIEFQRVN